MRIFATAFAGGALGKIFGALFIAVCLALGIGPDKWAAYIVSGLPQWVTPELARAVLLAAALLTALFLALPFFVRRFFPSKDVLGSKEGGSLAQSFHNDVELARIAADREKQERLRDRQDLARQRLPQPMRDVYLMNAVWRVHVEKWEKPPFPVALPMTDPRPKFWDDLNRLLQNEFRQAAADGRLSIWGKLEGKGVWKLIDAGFWHDNWIDWYKFIWSAPADLPTEPDYPKNAIHYTELQTSKQQVETIWPQHSLPVYPHKILALKITDAAFSFHQAHDETLLRGELAITMINATHTRLEKCYIVLERVIVDGQPHDLKRLFRGRSEFALDSGRSQGFIIATRDFKDIAKNEPWLIKLEPSGDFRLHEKHVFGLVLSLHSEYEFATQVTLKASIGGGKNVSVETVEQTLV